MTQCEVACQPDAMSIYNDSNVVTTVCGAETDFTWSHASDNVTLPSCSSKAPSDKWKQSYRVAYNIVTSGNVQVNKYMYMTCVYLCL